MKNKEIEELLKEMDLVVNHNKVPIYFTQNHVKTILSYIEQLEDKINWYENIDINKTIDKFRVEHNKEIKELHNKIEQLEKNTMNIQSVNKWLTENYGTDFSIVLKEYSKLHEELKEEQEDNYKQSQLLVEKQKKIKQLENNRDKAIEYIEWQKDNPQYDNIWRKYECESLINILKGDSDD